MRVGGWGIAGQIMITIISISPSVLSLFCVVQTVTTVTVIHADHHTCGV